MASRKFRYPELFSTPESKAEAFDPIMAQFYGGNFGRLSKTDMETLMFHLYIQRCREIGCPCDDYTLSMDLGITQSKVRNLKIRNGLQYPREADWWKQEFAACIPNARFDEIKRLVKVNIPDVNVMIELRNHMERQGWYDEFQLNPKLFQCRVDFFLSLCMSLEDGKLELSHEILEQIGKETQSPTLLQRATTGAAGDILKEFAVSASREVLAQVLKLVPFGGIAAKAVDAFIEVLTK